LLFPFGPLVANFEIKLFLSGIYENKRLAGKLPLDLTNHAT
jgi:hypothetical protein